MSLSIPSTRESSMVPAAVVNLGKIFIVVSLPSYIKIENLLHYGEGNVKVKVRGEGVKGSWAGIGWAVGDRGEDPMSYPEGVERWIRAEAVDQTRGQRLPSPR